MLHARAIESLFGMVLHQDLHDGMQRPFMAALLLRLVALALALEAAAALVLHECRIVRLWRSGVAMSQLLGFDL